MRIQVYHSLRKDMLMKHLHITTAILLVLIMVASAVPAAAQSYRLDKPSDSLAAGTLIYYEDFDNLDEDDTDCVLDALQWEKSEEFKTFTAQLSLQNDVLHIDNLEATVGESNDSYATVLDEAYAAKFTGAPYTYQYDVTYRDAGNTYRYLSVLLNYNGVDQYNTVDMRIRGDGYNQYRQGSDWVHYSGDDTPMALHDDAAILTKLFGVAFDENAMGLQNRTITVRCEVDPEAGCTVYVNGIKVSSMTDHEDKWKELTGAAHAIAFKSSTFLLADFDNFMIWSGVGCEPDLSVFAPTAEETAAETTAVSEISGDTTAAPSTFDPSAAAAVVSILAAAGYTIAKKAKSR